MKSIVSFALIALLPCIKASFPGSTFGIVYNTTSELIPATGHLAVLPFTSSSFLTTISETTPDLGGYFTVAGSSGGVLNSACSNIGIAALVPADHAIKGLKYVLQWKTGPLLTLPEGSVTVGFHLGPAPSYDTVLNANAGPGSWTVARSDESSPFIVGWSEDVAGGIPVTLVKTGLDFVACST